jgi:hypothetical protein
VIWHISTVIVAALVFTNVVKRVAPRAVVVGFAAPDVRFNVDVIVTARRTIERIARLGLQVANLRRAPCSASTQPDALRGRGRGVVAGNDRAFARRVDDGLYRRGCGGPRNQALAVDGSGIGVAIIDSGIADHPALRTA